MILGVVLAGGKSSRFGSDKALAVLGGQTLLAQAVDRLSGWCEKVIVAGRETAPAQTVPDWPRPGMGPLGGIAAALRMARIEDFDTVLSCGVDSADLPENLPDMLSPAPAYVAGQPVIGLWSSASAPVLQALLESNARHSMRAFAEAVAARAVTLDEKTANINTPADLVAWEKRHGI